MAGEIPSELVDEISAGVEAVTLERSGESDPPADDDGAGEGGEEPAAPAPAGESKGEEAAPPPVAGPSEAALERAVKAGIPLAEAKQYPNDALLNATCARIEGGARDAGSQSGAGTNGGEAQPADDLGGEAQPADDLVSAIPDLDPEDYDEEIVKGFRSLKEIIRQQQDTIAELRGGQVKDWFATQLETVKDFHKGDAEKIAGVREKFDVLRAGYKAAGKDVSDEDVFSEAAQLVLASDMEAARLDAKAEAAKKRSGQRISRPSGHRATPKGDDPVAEVGDLLNRKFFS